MGYWVICSKSKSKSQLVLITWLYNSQMEVVAEVQVHEATVQVEMVVDAQEEVLTMDHQGEVEAECLLNVEAEVTFLQSASMLNTSS